MLPITESGASLEQVISESISTLDSSVDGLPRAERHARSEGWFIQLEVGDLNTAPAFITPEESVLTWDERLSGTLTVSAGRSYSPTDPKFLKEAPGIPTPGTILRKETFGPGEAPVLFQVSPMDDPTAMKAYLAKYSGIPDDADASAYLEAVRLLLSEWSLTPRQHASILRILQALGGMHLGGETTDRLGRPAIAIRVAPLQPDGYENLLLLSRDSGEMIALETIYVGGVLELALPVPTVASYVAWK